MLQTIRKHSGSWGGRVLLGVMVVSFGVFWGMSDIVQDSGSSTVLAKVGGVKITKNNLMKEFQEHWQASIAQLEAQGQRRADILAAFSEPGFKSQAMLQFFEDMVQRVLIAQEIKRLNLVISDTQLRDIVQKTSTFHNSQGQFDRKLFEQILRHNHLNERVYLDKMRNELGASNLIASLVGTLRAPKALTDVLAAYQRDQRRVRLFVMSDDIIQKIQPDRDPSAAEVQEFYESNKDRFSLPETRSFRLLTLTLDHVLSEVTIKDDEAYRLYQTEKETFKTPETRKVSQLFIRNKDDFSRVQEALATGLNFDNIAKKFKSSDVRAETLPWIERSQLPTPVAEAIFSCAKGERTKTLSADQGWYIFQVLDIRPAAYKTFPDVKQALLARLKKDAGEKLLAERSDALTEAYLQGASIDDIAKSHKLTITEVEKMSARGEVLGHTKPKLSEKETVALASLVFATNDTSDMQKIAPGVYAMVHIEKVTPAHQLSLMDARPMVRKAWKDAQRTARQDAVIKEIMGKLESLPQRSVLTAAENQALTLADVGSDVVISHRGMIDKSPYLIPSRLKERLKDGFQVQNRDLKSLFATAPGRYFTLSLKNSANKALMIVGHVVEKTMATPMSREQQTSFHRDVTMSLSTDVLQGYLGALRTLHKVRLYEDNVENLVKDLETHDEQTF